MPVRSLPMKRSLTKGLILFAAVLPVALVLSAQERPERYALILRTEPLANQILKTGAPRSALASPSSESQRRQLLKGQDALRSALRERKIPVTGSVHTLVNAVFVTALPSRVAELKGMPEVAGVVR